MATTHGSGFQMTWEGPQVKAKLRRATLSGLLKAAEHLLGASRRIVPHEEGDLERSGTVSSDPSRNIVAVSYDRPYAVRQHEDMTLRHDEGREPKYLERPMHTERQTMLELIASEPRDAIGGSAVRRP